MRTSTIIAAVAAAAMSAGAAWAQSNQASPPLLSDGPKACPPGVTAPPSGQTTGAPSLSEQLSESKGVICPPAGVDPGIATPPVAGGRMPIIPPPGTPGGDPSIVPK